MARQATLAQLRGLEEIRARQLRNIRERIAQLEAEKERDSTLALGDPEPAKRAEEERFDV
jgi:hypothetical protein